jgi:hypothetical protein
MKKNGGKFKRGGNVKLRDMFERGENVQFGNVSTPIHVSHITITLTKVKFDK